MKTRFSHISPLLQLALLTLFIALGVLVATLLTSIAAVSLFDVSVQNTTAIMSNPHFLRFAQVIQVFCLLLIPSLAFLTLMGNHKDFEQFNYSKNAKVYLLAVIAILVSQPLIGWSAWLNSTLLNQFPQGEILIWLNDKEKEMADLTYLFLNTTQPSVMLVNIVIMAVLPALFEELLFRGILQQKLTQWWGNGHLAIFVVAIIFSAIHMQFLTFIPRFLLGMFLGYLLFWGKSLWLPIVAHFINNFIALITFYYQKSQSPDINPISNENVQVDVWIALLSAITIAVLMFKLRQYTAELSIKSQDTSIMEH